MLSAPILRAHRPPARYKKPSACHLVGASWSSIRISSSKQHQSMGSRMSSHSLSPLCRYSALFAASQPGSSAESKGLNKQTKNRGKRKTRQQNKKKKGRELKKKRGSNKNVKSSLRTDGLGNTDAKQSVKCRQNQCPSKLPARRAFGVHVYCTHQVVQWIYLLHT